MLRHWYVIPAALAFGYTEGFFLHWLIETLDPTGKYRDEIHTYGLILSLSTLFCIANYCAYKQILYLRAIKYRNGIWAVAQKAMDLNIPNQQLYRELQPFFQQRYTLQKDDPFFFFVSYLLYLGFIDNSPFLRFRLESGLLGDLLNSPEMSDYVKEEDPLQAWPVLYQNHLEFLRVFNQDIGTLPHQVLLWHTAPVLEGLHKQFLFQKVPPRIAGFKEELMAAAWHPRRVEKWVEAGRWDLLE